MRFPASLTVLALGMAALAAAQTAAAKPPIGATRARPASSNWGKLDPAYQACSKGHEQSPIDIRGARLNKALQPIEFHYIAGPVTLVNDGHTIVAHVDPGSYIIAGGVRYDLVEFDFHHPGEAAVQGQADRHGGSPGAQQRRRQAGRCRRAPARGPRHPNAVLAALWPHLPKTAGATEKVTEMVSAGGLLPADRGYWTYMGSLTAPPCTEGVRWFVFEQELSLSRDQLRAFAALFRMNTRGLQDPHGRRIEANE